MIKHSFKVGLSFGLTSGIITTLGLMTGLNAGTHSRVAVIGGVLTIAIADAASDALGIHVSEESEGESVRGIWEATIATLLSKFAFASLFIIPVLLLPLRSAIAVSAIFGLSALGVLTFFIAREQGESAPRAITEHLVVAITVIVLTTIVGDLIGRTFGNNIPG